VEGRTLSHFKILGRIGKGGMGVVYKALDENLRRIVALKVLPGDLVADEERRARFLNEARAAAAVTHPNIATVYEAGEAEGVVFIAMEYVDGLTLRHYLEARPLPVAEALRIAIQIADGLDRAHRSNIVHRDLKPENVIIGEGGRAKILDFGLAKFRAAQTEAITLPPGVAPEIAPEALTREGQIWGTPMYMSPEQARGEAVDGRSDLFSLGVILYEMITGRQPFQGRTEVDTISAVLRDHPAPIVRLNPLVAPAAVRAIERFLEKNPSHRFDSAADLKAALEASLQSAGGAVDVAGEPARTGGGRRWLLAAGVAAAIGVAAWFDAGGWRTSLTEFLGVSHVRSLAVLPFHASGGGESDEYLGLGIADSIIIKVSQIAGLTVRPTSAIRRYASEEIDALEAARRLAVDAVLDGTVQRSEDRLRVTVNLLQVKDGRSLMTESYDMAFTDVFAIQDRVSREVTSRLRIEMSPSDQERFARRQTASVEAYEHYLKGVYHFDRRDLSPTAGPDLREAVTAFEQAAAVDPNYALAHAQLAYACVWMAPYVEPAPAWVDRARRELAIAESLDPGLAVVPLVRAHLLWSEYEGFRTEDAIREIRKAQRLDPSVGHAEMGTLLAHLGLRAPALRELGRAREIDPTSEQVRGRSVDACTLLFEPDEAIANQVPDSWLGTPALALTWKGRFEEADRLIRRRLAVEPGHFFAMSALARLEAAQGDVVAAEARIAELARMARDNRGFHHAAYDFAAIEALAGKPHEAVAWLRTTVEKGMPNYPLFARDPDLDRVRSSPDFKAFMAELKPRWYAQRREFE